MVSGPAPGAPDGSSALRGIRIGFLQLGGSDVTWHPHISEPLVAYTATQTGVVGPAPELDDHRDLILGRGRLWIMGAAP